MDISNYSSEDFVLNPSFRGWVLRPDAKSNLLWEELLASNPSKYAEAQKARDIIIHLATRSHELTDSEFDDLWNRLDRDLREDEIRGESKVIPLNSYSTLYKATPKQGWIGRMMIRYRYQAACILVVLVGLGFLGNRLFTETAAVKEIKQLAYEERSTIPGVKSQVTLSDGSRVILNSGSKLKYVKNFEADRREVFLEGEAFFEVAKDSMRPFVVWTGKVGTKALGTSFNIKFYEGEALDISLLTGKVAVELPAEDVSYLMLTPGEAVSIDVSNHDFVKSRFDEELVTGWTKKTLVFRKTPLLEALRILENWYGVSFEIKNLPKEEVLFSGKFHDESLEVVLSGLSYTGLFDFEIKEDQVKIKF